MILAKNLKFQYDAKNLDNATGLLPLTIKVKRCYPTERGETDAISWHIADDRSAWGISGLTSGVMHFGAEHNLLQCIKVDLMPLFMGDLRLPILSLRRLVQKTSTSTSEHDSSISSMEGSYKGKDFELTYLTDFRYETGQSGRRRRRVYESIRTGRYALIIKHSK